MERSRLKLTVIFLLIVLNLCLLGVVVAQSYQTHSYVKLTREQAVLYLSNHGIQTESGVIPWTSSLEVPVKKLPERILEETPLPEEGLGERYEVQTMRRPETLVADFVRKLDSLNHTCTEITAITEGYRYSSQGDRAVLTPMWAVETDSGVYYLDCYSGTLSETL